MAFLGKCPSVVLYKEVFLSIIGERVLILRAVILGIMAGDIPEGLDSWRASETCSEEVINVLEPQLSRTVLFLSRNPLIS
jgi:hypothetical protein